jgi:uncharacterized RDD family membrane protein YckC
MIHRAMGISPTVGCSMLFDSAAESLPTRPAGFWQRIFAFAIDPIIVATVCLVLGLAFKNFFSRESALASILAFLIALVYFGWFGSKFGNG